MSASVTEEFWGPCYTDFIGMKLLYLLIYSTAGSEAHKFLLIYSTAVVFLTIFFF